MRSVTELKDEIKRIDDQLVRICFLGRRNCEEYITLKKKLIEVKDELCLTSATLIASSDELDIYEKRVIMQKYSYLIVPHNTYKIIGDISVDYSKNYNQLIGNVGYEIDEEYRGNGYTLKSLELLCNVFLEKGLEISVIVIDPKNIPSVKTAQKFGAVLVKTAKEGMGYDVYTVDMHQKVKSQLRLLNQK